MAPMALIGELYNTFNNIVTTDLISMYKKNIVFWGIHCDLDKEQVPENGIFWEDSFLLSKSLILRVKGIFLNFLQPPGWYFITKIWKVEFN